MHLTLSGTVVTAAQVRSCKNPNVAKKVKTRLLQYLVARIPNVPHLPRETKVDVSKCHACHVSKCHACHAKCSYMSPSATPATQKAAASTATCGNRARHQSQPSAIRATPATWNEGGRRWMSQSATPATQSAATCRQVPRLPRKKPRRPRRHLGTERATRASPMPYVPRLPRETKVDVSKCHACQAK